MPGIALSTRKKEILIAELEELDKQNQEATKVTILNMFYIKNSEIY